MKDHCLERVLFVVGNHHSGKSTQLRSLFRDVRLGAGGTIPKQRKLDDFHRLSNEQFLYLRLTSPHELKESLGSGKRGVTNFLKKTEDKVASAPPTFGTRWNFASALQPDASNNMPNVVETCKAFVRYFGPERTRIVFLNPDRDGNFLAQGDIDPLSRRLRRIPSVEVCWIDARDSKGNGLLLADFLLS
jgi:hypothetical protein